MFSVRSIFYSFLLPPQRHEWCQPEQLRWSGFRSYVPRRRHARSRRHRLRGRPILLQYRANATVFGDDLPFQLTRQTKNSTRRIGSPPTAKTGATAHQETPRVVGPCGELLSYFHSVLSRSDCSSIYFDPTSIAPRPPE